MFLFDMKESKRNLLNRTLFAYIGMVLCLLVLLPIAAAVTLGGHSLMFMIVFGGPIGLIAGLVYSDVKVGIRPVSIVIRVGISLVLIFLVVAAVSVLKFSPFLKNNWYIAIPLFVPFLVSVLSGLFFYKPETEP
jgi:hypothetical protein